MIFHLQTEQFNKALDFIGKQKRKYYQTEKRVHTLGRRRIFAPCSASLLLHYPSLLLSIDSRKTSERALIQLKHTIPKGPLCLYFQSWVLSIKSEEERRRFIWCWEADERFQRKQERTKAFVTEERVSLRLTRGNEEAGLLRLTEEASLCFPSFFIIF